MASYSFSSVFASSTSVLEKKDRILIEAHVRDFHGFVKLDHLGALDISINVPENVESFWLSLAMLEQFWINGKCLCEQKV